MPVINEVGKTYNRLTVVERGPNGSGGCARWYCKCSCGNPELVLVLGSSLRSGKTKSCGCLHREAAQKQGLANRKNNKYDLTGEYGIGYTSKGEEFYFDLEDYDLIKDYCWYLSAQNYIVCRRKTNTLLHRLIMNAQPGEEVDHINHNTVDNRKENLRICSSSQNKMNKGPSKISTSGIRGVYWYSNQQKWSAELVYNGQKIFLGLFDSKEEAARVRKEAEKIYYKEFQYKGGDAAYDERN